MFSPMKWCNRFVLLEKANKASGELNAKRFETSLTLYEVD